MSDLDIAIAHHQAGRLDEAEPIYREILRVAPKHLDALHLLGLVALQRGDHDAAVELIEKALAENPSIAEIHNSLGNALKAQGRLDAALESYRRAHALNPDLVGAYINLGAALLGQGQVDDAVSYFRKAERLGPGEGNNVAAFRMSLLDEDQARKGEPYVKQLKDVLVDTAYWSILDGDKVYSRETHGRNLANSPFVRGRIDSEKTRVIAVYPDPEIVIKERCIFVGGDLNYSHWLLRNLMKLSIIENNKDLRSLPLLLNADLAAYQSEALGLLGISRDRQILVNRNSIIKCNDIYVPTLLRNHPRMKMGLDWLRRKFLNNQETTTRENRDRIFVSRRDANKRHIVNEEDLVDRLAKLEFRVVVPGRMSFSEQVKTFSNVGIVVGAHSAGLANIVFAPLDCQMIEITSTAIEFMDPHRTICNTLGQKVVSIVSNALVLPSGETHINEMHYDFLVDVEEVVSVVIGMIADSSAKGIASW